MTQLLQQPASSSIRGFLPYSLSLGSRLALSFRSLSASAAFCLSASAAASATFRAFSSRFLSLGVADSRLSLLVMRTVAPCCSGDGDEDW